MLSPPDPKRTDDLPRERFFSALLAARPLLVLTGAGVSAGSGIPTYRDRQGVWRRSDPITHQEFTGDPRQRRRYWGRSTLGWPAVSGAYPSRAHRALRELERAGVVSHIVTQNVDRLHQRAGSEKAVDLHGRLDRVRCLSCGTMSSRAALQARLLEVNPWLQRPVSALRPDGDADLRDEEIDRVTVPACDACDGMLMPDVVFFGGSIPRDRIRFCEEALRDSGGLLVLGSSLQVYSGYRFCRWAKRNQQPLFIINPGTTRADELADSRLSDEADPALEALLARLDIPTIHTNTTPETA